MQSNIIYNFEDLRALLIEKSTPAAYFLILDDIYFEKFRKNTVISREVYNAAKKIVKPFSIIKYAIFHIKDKYSTQQIYDFINLLRKDTTILLTIFNPKSKEIFILFISNKDDSLLEHSINSFLEMEVL